MGDLDLCQLLENCCLLSSRRPQGWLLGFLLFSLGKLCLKAVLLIGFAPSVTFKFWWFVVSVFALKWLTLTQHVLAIPFCTPKCSSGLYSTHHQINSTWVTSIGHGCKVNSLYSILEISWGSQKWPWTQHYAGGQLWNWAVSTWFWPQVQCSIPCHTASSM